MKNVFATPKKIVGIGEVGKGSKKSVFGSIKDLKTDALKGNPFSNPNGTIKKLYERRK